MGKLLACAIYSKILSISFYLIVKCEYECCLQNSNWQNNKSFIHFELLLHIYIY